MPRRDVVVMAASAGGIEALRQVLAGVPPSYDGAIFVVLHMSAGGGQSLPGILDRAGPLRAEAARDGEPIRSGRVYVCVSDHHLLVADGHVHVRRGPRENGHRPAADALFRSAAQHFGPRTIGVVLSGTLSDGTAGLHTIRRFGGIAVVQDPQDALYDGMPSSALEDVGADHVVPASDIGPLLDQLASVEVPDAAQERDETITKEVAFMNGDLDALDGVHPGVPSPWPCPDCNGVLWSIDEADVLRFRCRVGHAWGADSLLHKQGAEIETALWAALRSLEDRAALCVTLAHRADGGGRARSAVRFRGEAEEMDASIKVLRRLLHSEAVGALTGDDG